MSDNDNGNLDLGRPRRFRFNRDLRGAIASAVLRERETLDPAGPRRKPSLPSLRFLQNESPAASTHTAGPEDESNAHGKRKGHFHEHDYA